MGIKLKFGRSHLVQIQTSTEVTEFCMLHKHGKSSIGGAGLDAEHQALGSRR